MSKRVVGRIGDTLYIGTSKCSSACECKALYTEGRYKLVDEFVDLGENPHDIEPGDTVRVVQCGEVASRRPDRAAALACVELVEKADGRKPLREFEVGEKYERHSTVYTVVKADDEWVWVRALYQTESVPMSPETLRTPCDEPGPDKKQENPDREVGECVGGYMYRATCGDREVEARAETLEELFEILEKTGKGFETIEFNEQVAEKLTSTFKVGDRVVITGEDQPSGVYSIPLRSSRGNAGVVKELREDGGVVVQTDGGGRPIRLPSSLKHEE